MWVRKQIDIRWRDLVAALGCCFDFKNKDPIDWSDCWPEENPLPFLSVRSGFDCLLSSIEWPADSEILISGFTIGCMPRIISENGYRPIAVDLDERTLIPDVTDLRRSLTSKTRAILVAHLFGMRSDLSEILEFAAQHKLMLIEDCAQNFVGAEYSGCSGATVSMFSFGPVKTCTALGGALLQVRDENLRKAVVSKHEQWSQQRIRDFINRIIKYSCLKTLSNRWGYGALFTIMNFIGRDFDEFINHSARGFSGPDFFTSIRKRPSRAFLSFLRVRLRSFNPKGLRNRISKVKLLQEELTGDFRLLSQNRGREGEFHSAHWLLPVTTSSNDLIAKELRRLGFDATTKSSLKSLACDDQSNEPFRVCEMESNLLFLPAIDEMSAHQITELATRVKEADSIKATSIPTKTDEDIKRER